MVNSKKVAIPEDLQNDISQAIRILKEGGCSEIFLFGSGVTGNVKERSDIDLAIRGCPKGYFFHLLGRLLWELNHPVDLVNLDTQDTFAQHLQKEGMLVRVG
ncbi:MAG TPA: nucleotidyltransferase domain-containing protein [Candidatus Brocadiales bacterium]|nr:nucleotidyltransferase domain-containing protein [Candidatus Brocadiales bacterium]